MVVLDNGRNEGRPPLPEKEIDGEWHKWCNDCNTFKPFSEHYMRAGKPMPGCKACRWQKNKQWKTENRERYNAWQREYKRRRGWVGR